jgi:hypothetical protein
MERLSWLKHFALLVAFAWHSLIEDTKSRCLPGDCITAPEIGALKEGKVTGSNLNI